jgi:HK97 family phage prohead protease
MTMNRVYWQGNEPKNWKRAAPQTSSIPALPIEFESKERGAVRTYRFIVSTDTVDRSNDTIDQAGWDLKAYRRSPVVLWAHDASQWPIGKATKIGVEGGKLIAEVMFADTFEGRKAQALVDAGMLKATSVGFLPTESKMSIERRGGYDFKKQQLMEFSIVPVPANPDCLICMSAKEEREQQAHAYRAQAKADMAAVTEAKRAEAVEARMASTTPAQRKREREATLLRIKGLA